MGILKQLEPEKTALVRIHEFIEKLPKAEREEWLEALRRADLYPTRAVHALLIEHGVKDINENAVIRYRRKLAGYVSAR